MKRERKGKKKKKKELFGKEKEKKKIRLFFFNIYYIWIIKNLGAFLIWGPQAIA